MSTLGTFGFEGAGVVSGVLQELLSLAEDQGSNMAALLCETGGGLMGAVEFDGAADRAERLKAEFKFDARDGDDTIVGGSTGGGAGDSTRANLSLACKS